MADVIDRLEIKLSADDLLITVNGQMAEVSQLLSAGDQVDFIPAISGGTDH